MKITVQEIESKSKAALMAHGAAAAQAGHVAAAVARAHRRRAARSPCP